MILRSGGTVSHEAKERLDKKLDNCITLAKVFELVKESVKRFLNMHRAGLMLGLADLGMKRGYFIGAFHPVGSNIIVVNRTPLEIALHAKERRIFNAYCFHLFLHEYLHSLGYIDEDEVKELTYEVCRLALGNDHPAAKMAEKGIAIYFPKVAHLLPDDYSNRTRRGLSEIELIDLKTPDYIQ
jgi:hypothetical protein